jgi:protease I
MKKILLLVEEGYEDLELHYPRLRLQEENMTTVVAGPQEKGLYKGKRGYPCVADSSFDQIHGKDFCAVIIPGGHAPDKLRMNPKVLAIMEEFHKQKKLIAFICHAGSVPISAKILSNVTCTSYLSIKDDLINAGANWVDKSVVVDSHFISSRTPADLPDFCRAIIAHLR